MNVLRTEQINSIIDKRKPLAKKIASVKTNLISLDSALENLAQHRDRLMDKVEDPDANINSNTWNWNQFIAKVKNEFKQGIDKVNTQFEFIYMGNQILQNLPENQQEELIRIAGLLLRKQKGILSAEESKLMDKYSALVKEIKNLDENKSEI